MKRRRRRSKGMESVVMPVRKMKPTLTLKGKSAKSFFGSRPGKKVRAVVTGRVIDMGISQYEPGRPPTATIEIDRTEVG